jgi:Ca2+/Na+ antiporter
MKKLILLNLLLLFFVKTYSQEAIDSATYQQQRKKINTMLAHRKTTFSAYQESLSKHTGIFGLQTKKDIRRSQDILMEIVNADNEIFRQLKILFDYKVAQQTKDQRTFDKIDDHATASQLKLQLQQLKARYEKEKQHQQSMLYLFISLFVLMLGSILYLINKNRSVKV